MGQLTVGDILKFVGVLKKSGMSTTEIAAMPVYLGNDDELNGIHCGWYTNLVDANNVVDEDIITMINEDRCNIKLEGKALLIS